MFGPKMDDPDMPLAVLFCRWPAAVSVFFTHGMVRHSPSGLPLDFKIA